MTKFMIQNVNNEQKLMKQKNYLIIISMYQFCVKNILFSPKKLTVPKNKLKVKCTAKKCFADFFFTISEMFHFRIFIKTNKL